MKKLKLVKGLSYTTKGFSCVKAVPFDAEDGLSEKLLKTGRFEEISEPALNVEPAEEKLSVDDIARMKKDELIAVAAEHGVDIEGCKNNDERAERIQGALGLVSFVKMGMED